MPNPASAGLPNPSNYTVDAVNDVVTDNVTGLMWQRSIDSATYKWADAITACDNLVYGGYSDWRLPSRIELVSIIDFTTKYPAIDTNVFNYYALDNDVWTSTSRSATSAYIVEFIDGVARTRFNLDLEHVRCVR